MANDSDLVQRLRSVDISWNEAGEYCAEAAARIEELNAMLATATALVEKAYSEGFREGYDGGWLGGYYLTPWKKSEARAAINKLTRKKKV